MVSIDESLEFQYYLTAACSILSILGSGFIIAIYLLLPNLRAFYTKLIFFIAISELLRSICSLIPCNLIHSKALINIIAIISDSTFLITIIWSAYISITLYKLIISFQKEFKNDYKYWFYSTWVCVPILNVFPTITNSHGVSGTICTYSFDKIGKTWRLVALYIPVWVFILVSIVACYKIYSILNRFEIDEEKKMMVMKLFLYPIVLIIEVAPITISMIFSNFTPITNTSLFSLIAFCLYSIHGFSNAIIYGFTIGLKNIMEDYNASYLSMQNKESDRLRLESCEGPNLLYSTFSEE